jgi:hypothetical protein
MWLKLKFVAWKLNKYDSYVQFSSFIIWDFSIGKTRTLFFVFIVGWKIGLFCLFKEYGNFVKQERKEKSSILENWNDFTLLNQIFKNSDIRIFAYQKQSNYIQKFLSTIYI